MRPDRSFTTVEMAAVLRFARAAADWMETESPPDSDLPPELWERCHEARAALGLKPSERYP